MNILVLGGYGLIGAAVCRHLLAAGHSVTGLGRDTATAALQMPGASWIDADIAGLVTPAAWGPILENVNLDAIVNCSGALQDGARDRLEQLQSTAMQALFQAATDRQITRFVQISAARSHPDASTAFMRTKGVADAALRQTKLEWTILRPGLVLDAQAHGGTALLRALAATPGIVPAAFGDRPVQTVHVDDVARAVETVLDNKVPTRQTYDLVEDNQHTLMEILRAIRRWLGLPAARELAVPEWIVKITARFADGLGWLGWRSPMRTTAITELSAGVEGDPGPWRNATGASLLSLEESLLAMPANVQERWFARLFFIKPLAIGTLALFWLATGVITLANPAAAIGILADTDATPGFAAAIVYGGAIIDLALGAAILVHKWMKPAALGMIAVTLAYLAGGTLLMPDLWLDPLGPLVKTIPAMTLALAVLALAQNR